MMPFDLDLSLEPPTSPGGMNIKNYRKTLKTTPAILILTITIPVTVPNEKTTLSTYITAVTKAVNYVE